jgi:son of sevenless
MFLRWTKSLGNFLTVPEGKLKVFDNRKRRLVDRYVILCDGIIIVCKQNGKRGSVTSSQGEYRLREKHLIRKVDVLDREDTGAERHTFELAPREQPKIIFKAESEEEKNSWMAALVMLNTKFMLERLLDVILSNEEKKHPLRFPPKSRYLFAEENSSENIVFEQTEKSNGVPLIKVTHRLLSILDRNVLFEFANLLQSLW